MQLVRGDEMGEKPTSAFILSLIGGIFILLSGLVFAVFFGLLGAMVSLVPIIGAPIGGLLIGLGIVGLIFGILVIIGAFMINSGEKGKVTTGSIIVLVFSILSLFVVGGGFIIGFLLGLIGSIIGLTWKPTTTQS
ncbi:MAG: hypothetical protein NZ872_00280 [Archaeoglobaceae archaeon]|nr:hypothetical protein [Archaeoglobaceae archaeon]MDW8127637.1 hypothetical protein [Archaeoglobaceae archaeon]